MPIPSSWPPDGAPLPPVATVMRLVGKSAFQSEQAVTEKCFQISSADKLEDEPALSVYETTLTTAQDARRLMKNPEMYYAYVLLNVRRVCAVIPVENTWPSEEQPFRPLRVIWRTMYSDLDSNVVDRRPGADGHAGITGLSKPPGIPQSIYRSIRGRLVLMANEPGATRLF